MSYRLLVIEGSAVPTDASVRAALARDADFSCQQVGWETVPQSLGNTGAHAVVAVAVPHTPEVTRVFEWLHHHPISIPTFAVLPNQTAEPLLRLAAETTDEFIFSPIRTDELRQRLGRVLGAPRHDIESVRQRLLEEMSMTQLVGKDPTFLRAIEQVPRIARSDMPVLITGETGTGKELCARAIHFLSKRRDHPFIAADCAALPDHLVENELFGHARGAFTDAHRDQQGLIGMAEGGTLLLDEIDTLSLTAQGKLLRFLQERTFRPLGSDRFVRANVNVIAATNRDLEAVVQAKQFRADLFYRLNVLRLHLPALRERLEDIAILASHFLNHQHTAADVTARSFGPGALRMLAAYRWPGNVRELYNVVQRAAVTCRGMHILPCHLSIPGFEKSEPNTVPSFRAARAAAVANFEQEYVAALLNKHAGNVSRAAREANKDRRVFGRLIKKYQIDRAKF